MVDNGRIKLFVQKTLGCGCPEDVFRSIGCRRTVPLSDGVIVNSIVTVGDRLLIYVHEPAPEDVADRYLPVLVTAGRQERASQGLNRFRLVIITDDAAEKQKLSDLFQNLRGTDEKMHLHIIRKAENIFRDKHYGQEQRLTSR